MHPTADTPPLIVGNRLGRRVMPGVRLLSQSMIRVFISSCTIDSGHPSALVGNLLAEGFEVSHSPGKDQGVNWGDWYNRDSLNALDQTDIFIIAVTENWQFSTWMQHEAWEAQKRLRAGRIRRMLFYNPGSVQVTAKGMLPFLKERLPDDLEELALYLGRE